IQHWSNDHGYPPTIREIGKAVRINSTSVVNYNLNKLVKEGYISRSKDVSRGIRLNALQEVAVDVVGDGSRGHYDMLRVPMAGQIVAGQPAPIPGDDFDYYDDEEAIPVPRMLIGNNDPARIFALKVQGQSMIDAMINDDDIVVLKRQAVATNGEMV